MSWRCAHRRRHRLHYLHHLHRHQRHLLLLLYVCRKWRGVPAALDAQGLKWVRPLELHGLAMPPADAPLIGLLEALV